MKVTVLASTFAVLLLIAPAVSRAQETTPQAAPASWCVSAWFPSSDNPGGLDSIMNNLDVLSVVNPFWYTPNPDGSVSPTPVAEDAEQLAAWREAGLMIMPSVISTMWQMIDTPELRTTHIANIVDLVERMDYDGIDIDYESFNRSTRDNFSAFIEELAAVLHARGHLLSIAVHAKTTDAGTWEGPAAQDWSRLAPAVDVFTIMTYDFSSSDSPPGPIGPPDWVLDVLAYAQTITDLSKVRMGLHFYGYSWLRGNPPASPISWVSVQRYVDSFDLPITRDPSDMEARIDLDVRGLPDQTVYVADAAGIAYKLDLVLAAYPDLGGIAIWGLGGEDPANWDVLRDAKPDAPPCALSAQNR